MRIRLAPSTVGDLAGIRDYYRDISKELEVQFLDQLDVAMALPHHALDRLDYKGGGVVAGHHNTDARGQGG